MNLKFWKKATVQPGKGYALCIGLNAVDPAHYDGWSGRLNACEADAEDMRDLLKSKGFATDILLTKQAVSSVVLRWLLDMSKTAKPGDIVVVTSSSHGGQVPDQDGNDNGYDETICMYDRQIIDDELELAWSRFAAGVRLFFVSDSCHSGTMARVMHSAGTDRPLASSSRAMPNDLVSSVWFRNQGVYALAKASARSRSKIKASLLAFGACQDNQTAEDGTNNGAFTGALRKVLASYPSESPGKVIARVRRMLPASQSPTYVYGGHRDPVFEASPVFAISQVP